MIKDIMASNERAKLNDIEIAGLLICVGLKFNAAILFAKDTKRAVGLMLRSLFVIAGGGS